jgi:hypothetical protein
MEAGVEVRGAEVAAGLAASTETPSAPQEGAPAAPAGEWMEIPAERVHEHLRSLREGEALEIEVLHYGAVSHLLIFASHVRAGAEERPLTVYTVFEWVRRERGARRWFAFAYQSKWGSKLERGLWVHGGAWSGDQLRSLVEWLAGKPAWDGTPWSELKIRARRYVLWVRP